MGQPKEHTRGTIETISKEVGVSPNTVLKYKKVQDQGTEELKKAVDEKVIPISKGAEISKENPETQKALVHAFAEEATKGFTQMVQRTIENQDKPQANISRFIVGCHSLKNRFEEMCKDVHFELAEIEDLQRAKDAFLPVCIYMQDIVTEIKKHLGV